jgi:hypothetical protein
MIMPRIWHLAPEYTAGRHLSITNHNEAGETILWNGAIDIIHAWPETYWALAILD